MFSLFGHRWVQLHRSQNWLFCHVFLVWMLQYSNTLARLKKSSVLPWWPNLPKIKKGQIHLRFYSTSDKYLWHSGVIGGNLFLNDDATIFHADCSTIVPSPEVTVPFIKIFTKLFTVAENFSDRRLFPNLIRRFILSWLILGRKQLQNVMFVISQSHTCSILSWSFICQ